MMGCISLVHSHNNINCYLTLRLDISWCTVPLLVAVASSLWLHVMCRNDSGYAKLHGVLHACMGRGLSVTAFLSLERRCIYALLQSSPTVDETSSTLPDNM